MFVILNADINGRFDLIKKKITKKIYKKYLNKKIRKKIIEKPYTFLI